MKFCTNCGAQIPDGSKFCTECGQKIQQAAPAPVAEKPAVQVYEAPAAPTPIYEPPAARIPVNEPPVSPVPEAPRTDNIPVQVYGTPVNHSFSAPKQAEGPQSGVYGAPVSHNFSAPIQAEGARSGTYGDAVTPAPAAPQYEPPKAPAAPVPQYTPPQNTPAAKPAESGSYTAPAAVIPEKPQKPARQKTSGGKKLPLPLIIGAAVVAVVILVVALFAGGGGDKNDPNLGMYNAVSCNYSGMELGAEGEWIELLAGGKFKVLLMGDEYTGKWTLDGESLTVTQGGDTYKGTLKDGTIVLDFGGVIYTYVNENAKLPPSENQGTKETTPKPQEATIAGYWTLLRSEGEGDMAMDEETVRMLRELGIEIYVDLKDDGTGTFMIEEPFPVTWDGNTITDDEGFAYSYELKDGQLHIAVDGADMIFIPGEGIAPEVNVPGGDDIAVDENLDPMLTFWEGDWYGWWVIWTGDGTFADMEDDAWDAYAHIDVNEDYTGTVTLWEVDSSRDEPIAVVDVSFRSGVSEHGCMVSESGWFMDCEVGHADWNLDVGASMVRMFDSMIAIDSYYYDPADSENNFNYVFILRPWGMDWEDVRGVDADGTYYSDMMPLEYDSWYLPLIENGVETMPESYEAGLALIG